MTGDGDAILYSWHHPEQSGMRTVIKRRNRAEKRRAEVAARGV